MLIITCKPFYFPKVRSSFPIPHFRNDMGFLGPISQDIRPRNFLGLKANFKTQTCWIVPQFLAHKPVNFASLTDNFILLFSKLLKLWSCRVQRKSFLQLAIRASWSKHLLAQTSFQLAPTTFWWADWLHGSSVIWIPQKTSLAHRASYEQNSLAR